ncbi:hypothetical protein BO70DRAFT_378089 [Aspergillus heteromorphus CBS 117.55]|uniref:Tat pathway signal sequence n=1 Tax=Aspergillus heteromorphus CBS 117.55 TaxID=1448321 RepID=A0A317WLT5_9EURO|nr:uncharacterized protein BO70DRAFT_378089 [Aspergillus heteromorphus CBS 117.55]PWY87456.1 hypothetical protein BO70DRAFT_378089 [Aspergillus heteromorphus CBS 117.55]
MPPPEYHFLGERHDPEHPDNTSPCKRWTFLCSNVYLAIIHTILLTLSLSFFLSIRHNTTESTTNTQCAQPLSLEGLSGPDSLDRCLVQRFSNDPHSVFRGPPSNETDEAWDRIVKVGPFNIPIANADPGIPSNSPIEPHLANLGVFHQLHCLKALWQHTYLDYYAPRNPIFSKSDLEIHNHLDHCTDYLRQALTCHSDTSIITFHSTPGHSLPTPSYELPRTCRDFEALRAWVVEHEAALWVRSALLPSPSHSLSVERSITSAYG